MCKAVRHPKFSEPDPGQAPGRRQQGSVASKPGSRLCCATIAQHSNIQCLLMGGEGEPSYVHFLSLSEFSLPYGRQLYYVLGEIGFVFYNGQPAHDFLLFFLACSRVVV